MTINPAQFSAQVVIPTLETLGRIGGIPCSDTAYYLVMGTIAQESLLGTYLVQAAGPALGICQIQPATLDGLIACLSEREKDCLAAIATPASPAQNVVTNLAYAVAITRLYYWQIPAPLPTRNTVADLFAYYKRWYNTPEGAATLAQFAQNWQLTGVLLPTF
jgi:hypothetical protein